MPHYIDWGLFALGLFIGIVVTATAMLAFVVVEYTEYKLFKDRRPSSILSAQKKAQKEERGHA